MSIKIGNPLLGSILPPPSFQALAFQVGGKIDSKPPRHGTQNSP